MFVVSGYHMIIERDGVQAANEWKKKMETAIKQNHNEIDEIVKNYCISHPEKLQGESKGKRNSKGYEPAYFPQEQGLPQINDELKRVGLIK